MKIGRRSESAKGVWGESNPPPRLSQSRVQHQYTTDAIRRRQHPDQESNPELPRSKRGVISVSPSG